VPESPWGIIHIFLVSTFPCHSSDCIFHLDYVYSFCNSEVNVYVFVLERYFFQITYFFSLALKSLYFPAGVLWEPITSTTVAA
jgi:hypothetical protein